MECIVYKFAAWRTADLLIKYSFSDELTIFRHFQDSFFRNICEHTSFFGKIKFLVLTSLFTYWDLYYCIKRLKMLYKSKSYISYHLERSRNQSFTILLQVCSPWLLLMFTCPSLYSEATDPHNFCIVDHTFAFHAWVPITIPC